jgi:hypothetical protein
VKIYKIMRTERGVTVVVAEGGFGRLLPHVLWHSPTGFECGYSGSGPADLALSIMADYWGVETAKMQKRIHGWAGAGGPVATLNAGDCGEAGDRVIACYQQFKQDFIAPLHVSRGEVAEITADQIAVWLKGVEHANS